MNNISEQALLGEVGKTSQTIKQVSQIVEKLKASHNGLVQRTGSDFEQHAGALKQLAAGFTSLEQRVGAMEQVLRAIVQRANGQAQTPGQQQQPAPARAAAPATQPQAPRADPADGARGVVADPLGVTAPAKAATNGAAASGLPMGSGWGEDDDEEDAEFDDA